MKCLKPITSARSRRSIISEALESAGRVKDLNSDCQTGVRISQVPHLITEAWGALTSKLWRGGGAFS